MTPSKLPPAMLGDLDFGGGFDDDDGDYGAEGEEAGAEPDYNEMLREENHNQAVAISNMLSLATSLDIERFDQRFLKNWAGPTHWKFHPSSGAASQRRREAPEAGDDEEEAEHQAAAGKSKARTRKEPFRIDFFAPPVDAEQVFKPSDRTTRLAEKSEENDNLLPPDQRYSIRDLLCFHTRPEWFIQDLNRSRSISGLAGAARRLKSSAADNQAAAQNDLDALQFSSAQLPANIQGYHYPTIEEDSMMMGGGGAGSDDDDMFEGPSFTSEPFGLGDFPYPSFPQPGGAAAASGAAVASLGRRHSFSSPADWLLNDAPPQSFHVGFSALQSTLNVKKLKSELWTELNTRLESQDTEDDSTAAAEEEKGKKKKNKNQLTDDTPQPTEEFQDLLTSIPSRITAVDQLSQVSVPFCFICLLHLANEKELELQQDPQDMLSSLTITRTVSSSASSSST